MITVIHAYSRGNPGDGLLVDESLMLLARLGVALPDIRVVALEPGSFGPLPRAVGLGPPRADGLRRLAGAGALLAGLPHQVRTAIAGARAVVGVGGGYLRTDSPYSAAKTLLAHGGQLRAAAAAAGRGARVLYLPGSIGPLTGVTGALLARWLHRVPHLAVRDDRSLAQIPHAQRFPDMALLRLARRGVPSASRPGSGAALLAVRALPRPGAYMQRLRGLLRASAASGGMVPAVASRAGTSNDDRRFTAGVAWLPGCGQELMPLEEALRALRPAVVVSVRLHGALAALLAGVPAIHLSYERKGLAAFEDLGLGAWLHPARSFNPYVVQAQVDALREDAGPYWERVAAAVPRLLRQGAELDEFAACALGLRGGARV
ncbi:polysaccharide pyruvyl transferase family protein [Streptomyces sp. UNOC14_S4]|uniref:polysaccharide pyruvyl transferase family protein n=1 Tax=Streptomyces sp. UNOC14_S4 TaxID=2872340 RepID=UPI001E62E4DE|nr:polysaccharide pyruvyl transferase family protein [Streptomyces sp. UNOC14_S4]MCC3768842.1 polysaccharide pyruvyl transferase family protein [Streptomyces sp. UNOC14_S4]